MTREEFQQTVSERFQNTDSGFGNMTQRELILLQIASNEYEQQVKNCSIPDVVGQSEQLKAFLVWLEKEGYNLDFEWDDTTIGDYIESL